MTCCKNDVVSIISLHIRQTIETQTKHTFTMKKTNLIRTSIMALSAVAVCFMAVSCQSGKNVEKQDQATVTETAPAIDTVITMQTGPFLISSELPWETPAQGVKRQIMGYNDNIMMVKVDFEAGSDGGGAHAHPHSQSTVIVSGVFEVTIDGQTQTLKAGDGFYVAPNKMHVAICKEAGSLIDAFSPVRADFLKK